MMKRSQESDRKMVKVEQLLDVISPRSWRFFSPVRIKLYVWFLIMNFLGGRDIIFWGGGRVFWELLGGHVFS